MDTPVPGSCCDAFVARYAEMIPAGLSEEVLREPKAGDKLNAIAIRLKDSGRKLYVLIDEYDNFTNTILAESGLDAYNSLCHGDGFFKDFFARLFGSFDAPPMANTTLVLNFFDKLVRPRRACCQVCLTRYRRLRCLADQNGGGTHSRPIVSIINLRGSELCRGKCSGIAE